MLKLLKVISMVVVIVNIFGCSATPTSESTGQFIDSATLTTKVKASLIDELSTKGLAIEVKTFKDEVQLSGFVNNQILKNRAGRIAAGVPGVRRVSNNLIVK